MTNFEVTYWNKRDEKAETMLASASNALAAFDKVWDELLNTYSASEIQLISAVEEDKAPAPKDVTLFQTPRCREQLLDRLHEAISTFGDSELEAHVESIEKLLKKSA